MLERLKRLFAGKPPGPDLGEVADWAQRRGHAFRRARDDTGFVIEGTLEGKPWRLEWGPPQRPYIAGRELRLRMELAMPSEAQMLLLSRPLLESLERQTYEQFTEGNQTQIGTSTPEEMRWLVMFPKINLGSVPELKGHFAAVAGQEAIGLAWIEGPLANALVQARGTLLAADPPFVLMVLRNRGYLRVQLADPEPRAIGVALGLFEVSITRAMQAAAAYPDASTGWGPSTASAWQSSRADDGGSGRS
ncbi:MAG: hypothetical protein JSR59_03690 [Proteobacteria bacterium]|nr:hypothetical protein [Pseudomonadota bacterium]